MTWITRRRLQCKIAYSWEVLDSSLIASPLDGNKKNVKESRRARALVQVHLRPFASGFWEPGGFNVAV